MTDRDSVVLLRQPFEPDQDVVRRVKEVLRNQEEIEMHGEDRIKKLIEDNDNLIRENMELLESVKSLTFLLNEKNREIHDLTKGKEKFLGMIMDLNEESAQLIAENERLKEEK